MKIILLCFFVASCSHISFDPTVKPEKKETTSNKMLWMGKPVETLDLHPSFAAMQMDSRLSSSGIEVRSYRNSGGKASEAQCNALFGCRGTQVEVVCSHVFYVKDKQISDYKRVGSCTEDENSEFAPI